MPTHSNSKQKANTQLTIATAIIKSSGKYTNESRTELLKDIIGRIKDSVDVVLLPAGYYWTHGKADKIYKYAVGSVKKILTKTKRNIIVCFGVDGKVRDETPDQMALAVSRKGLIALGRKFFPTNDEKGNKASNHMAQERGYTRIFEVKGKRIYLAVCYDGFGIRKQNLSNPGFDIIFDLIHRFTPPPEEASSESCFARHGLAGAAKQWRVPVFGSAVFFNRSIPEKWPSGVVWDQGDISTQSWKYEFNPLTYYDELFIESGNGEDALIRMFKLD